MHLRIILLLQVLHDGLEDNDDSSCDLHVVLLVFKRRGRLKLNQIFVHVDPEPISKSICNLFRVIAHVVDANLQNLVSSHDKLLI